MRAAHPASVSCARLGRVIPPSDCAALICRTGEAADLQSCFVCPAGQALAAGCPDHARLVRRRDAVPDAVVLLRVLGEALRDDPSAPQISIRAWRATPNEASAATAIPIVWPVPHSVAA